MSSLVDYKESPVIALPNKIYFAQIGQVVPELRSNNFSCVNLQWLTNAEYNLYCVCGTAYSSFCDVFP